MRIGILGGRRTGKDTVAGFLMECIPTLKQASFAGPLKRDVEDVLESAASFLDYQSAIHTALADRNVMGPLWQWWGTELVRRTDEQYWINRFDKAWSGVPDVVVTDVRFKNEAEYIRRIGGVLVRIHGYGFIPPEDIRSSTHQSETELQSIECDLIVNNGRHITLPELQNQVYNILLPQIEEFLLE